VTNKYDDDVDDLMMINYLCPEMDSNVA